MKILLVMFEEETFPDSRWGTYGSRSTFVEQVFDLEWYEDLNSMEKEIVSYVSEFKVDHPNGTVNIYNIKDYYNNPNIIVKIEHEVNEILEQRKLEKKKLEEEKNARYKEKCRQEDLKKLAELKAKYE